MSIYQSMQRVRFSSTDDYEKFKIVFGDVRHHLKTLPGFLHLTWWTHPQDPTWHNEVSFWTSYEALNDWHMNAYHKHAKNGRSDPADRGGHHYEFRVQARPPDPRVSDLRAHPGPAVRLAYRAGGAGGALPKMRLPLPDDARDMRKHRSVQGRPGAGGALNLTRPSGPSSRDMIRSVQAVEPHCAAGEHLMLGLGGRALEALANHVGRAGKEPVAMRIVGGP